jgi:hypothetical protein
MISLPEAPPATMSMRPSPSMSPVATDTVVLIRSDGSVTVKTSAPVAPLSTRRTPDSTRPPPVLVVEPKITSGTPSPVMSMIDGVLITLVPGTALAVQGHSITGAAVAGGIAASRAAVGTAANRDWRNDGPGMVFTL